MQEIKNITCIECPMGCEIQVSVENGVVLSVIGNRCPRGKAYGENEVTCPKRVITTTVRTNRGDLLPVKTSQPVIKARMFEVMKKINSVVAVLPIRIGDIVAKDIDAGVDLLATDNRD